MVCTCLVSPDGSVVTSENIFTTYGSSVNLTCSAGGGPNNTYEWWKEREPVFNMPVLQILRISGSDAGAYQCVVRNEAGDGSESTVLFGMHYFCYRMNTKAKTNNQILG